MKAPQMLRLASRAVCSLAMTVLAGAALASPPAGKGYKLVFEDSFNGTSLDTTAWSYNYPWSTYHNGMANMQPSQVTVNNGVLSLKAENFRSIWNPWGVWRSDFGWLSFDYTSGTVNTQGKKSWKYGYFEGRFKIPAAKSAWPAFWMLQDGWPPELDIFEFAGSPSTDHYTYHYTSNGSNASWGGSISSTDYSQDWHTFGVEWTPGELAFYVDDKLVARNTNATAISQMTNMYYLIDLQVGGWASAPNAAEYPQTLQVDWVRTWQIDDITNGNYQFRPKVAPTRALDVPGWSNTNGEFLDVWDAGSGLNQYFGVAKLSNGSYSMEPYPGWGRNRLIDAYGATANAGTRLDQWTKTLSYGQQWRIEDTGGGWYRISSELDGNASWTVSGTGANGSSVALYPYAATNNQLWRIFPAPSASTITAPTVLSKTKNMAMISWGTKFNGTSVVEYGTTSSYGKSATGTADVFKHLVTLPGLTAGTTYHYRVKTVDFYGNTLTSSDYTFTTLP